MAEDQAGMAEGTGGKREGLSADRVALGRAVQARADDVARLVDQTYAQDLAGEAFDSARFGTFLIGRWLETGQVASDEDEVALSRQGERAMLVNAHLATVAKAYLRWRDVTTQVIGEEATRLGTDQEVVDLACNVVRLSCDASLVRVVRQFDATRRTLQGRLREEQETLAHQALHDQLTGLPNRALLTDRLRQAASARREDCSAVVLFLDLDNFKVINDRFGHPAGDGLLTAVAERLRGLVRATDTVARLGGDEFVVLAVDLDDPVEGARSLAERIHESMRSPVKMGERNLHTSVSIGIAGVVPGTDSEVTLARADAAMYQAKRGGPAHFAFYDAVIGEERRRHGVLAHDLRDAHERGELSVHYQPLFTVDGGTVGAEALLRWEHPELGDIPPLEFVPILERSRQIVPVGRWVLQKAVAQCRRWRESDHPDLTVSVNVSARQLQDPSFVDDVSDALARARLDPGALVLEITESVLVSEMAPIGAVLERIRQLGVHLALDDFGTGYSSLLYLKGLPIDRLKVDRSFVAGLGTSTEDTTIVATVVDLAHKLGLAVVAEGVETEAELQAVRQMGCDQAQGFLLARPVPPESLPHPLTARAPGAAGAPGVPCESGPFLVEPERLSEVPVSPMDQPQSVA